MVTIVHVLYCLISTFLLIVHDSHNLTMVGSSSSRASLFFVYTSRRYLCPKDRLIGLKPSHYARIFSSASPNPSKHSSAAKAYADLAKARLSALVVTTTAAGFIATGSSPLVIDVLVAACTGTALCSSAAAAVNQIVERSRDAKMKRTQLRPLVTGALSVGQAQRAALLWSVAGTGVLWVGTDPVTTMLGVGNMALYAGVYTYMKPVSVANTWVGAVVGAIPPVMGVTAATGGCLWNAQALVLGATLYFWQLPHFFALSHMYATDYARGGFRMHPHPPVVRQALCLSAIPLATTACELTSSMFALESLVLNAYWMSVVHKFSNNRTNANARKVFLTSLWYLPAWLSLYLLHSRVWDKEIVSDDDFLMKWIRDNIIAVREQGRGWCVHEQLDAEEACPVTVTRRVTQEQINAVAETVQDTHIKDVRSG